MWSLLEGVWRLIVNSLILLVGACVFAVGIVALVGLLYAVVFSPVILWTKLKEWKRKRRGAKR